jgi:non-reducing end alpha-L-arabinofuranosidase
MIFKDIRSPFQQLRRVGSALAIFMAVVGALTIANSIAIHTAQAATTIAQGPCDLYKIAATPCVAAHSTVRTLLSTYAGALYQVQRASDSTTQDIGQLSDGYANAATQDTFCAATTCVITKIYDQSSEHNDLTIAPPGGAASGAGPKGYDLPAAADALPIIAGGHQVYGVSISPGMGYRNNATTGVATNGQPEGMYMVTSATHVNSGCCFDYGNAEANSHDTGNGHMDAVNFGTECWFSPCTGKGPWVQADMENGLFQSGDASKGASGPSGGSVPATLPYVTAWLKNDGQKNFALKWGNAQSGALTTTYSGALPTFNGAGYTPMNQEGAILLGTGGDNSNGSAGSFFEGVMTAGFPTDTTDNVVQSNIVAVGYGAASSVTSGSLTAGSAISLQATTACCTADYLRNQSGTAAIAAITSASAAQDKGDATWIVRPGLADSTCVSFVSRDNPGAFLRHQNFHLYMQPFDGTALNRSDATFCSQAGNSGAGAGYSFQSKNYPTKYIRHYYYTSYVASNGGSNAWDSTSAWAQDTTFLVTQPWAP